MAVAVGFVSRFRRPLAGCAGAGATMGCFWRLRVGAGRACRFREPVSLAVGCSPPGPEGICQALVGRGRRVDVGEGPMAGFNAVGAVGGQPPKSAGATGVAGGGRRG